MTDIMVGFLLGAITAGAGGYIATKCTDQRRTQEQLDKEKNKFQEVARLMPEIVRDLGSLLSKPGTLLVRKIVVLANSRVVFTPSETCFYLMGDQYKDLAGKISILENTGYIVAISKDGAEIYRMTEEFVKLVVSLE